jgi:hypothetical protein
LRRRWRWRWRWVLFIFLMTSTFRNQNLEKVCNDEDGRWKWKWWWWDDEDDVLSSTIWMISWSGEYQLAVLLCFTAEKQWLRSALESQLLIWTLVHLENKAKIPYYGKQLRICKLPLRYRKTWSFSASKRICI